jgi:hypothetical protein
MSMNDYGHNPAEPTRNTAPFTRKPLVVFVLTAAVMIVSLIWVVICSPRLPAVSMQPLKPLVMADQLDFYDSSGAWNSGKMVRLELFGAASQLGLNDGRNRFPRSGTWTSPEVTTQFAFTELIPSYNPHCPPETGLRFDVRTRDAASAKWSNWFYLGSWGRTLASVEREIQNDFGSVEVDTLKLARPADAYQVRIHFYAFNLNEKVNPTLRRLSVVYSGAIRDGGLRKTSVIPVSLAPDFSCDIPVPFRAQGNAARPLRPEICSPTSVSMVMQYLGRDLPTEENALAIYDSEYGLFGNWARAVAWAGENGFDAWVTRYRNWDQVKATLAQGQPIIASIRFDKGQCPSFVLKQTDGHLIVIRGMTRQGDLIVNDPVSRDKGNGAVYKASELAKAWFEHGGVGYIIRKPLP